MINGLFSQLERLSSALQAGCFVLIFTLVFLTAPAVADKTREWSIDLNGLSVHSEDRYVDKGVSRKYNETNSGLGISIELPEWNAFVRKHRWTEWIDRAGIDADIKFGMFDNSYRQTSLYAGPFLHKDLGRGDWKMAPGMALLLASGYQDTPEDAPAIFPLPVFGLELGHKALKVNVGFVPWGKVDFATLQLQFVPAYW